MDESYFISAEQISVVQPCIVEMKYEPSLSSMDGSDGDNTHIVLLGTTRTLDFLGGIHLGHIIL